MAEKSGGNAEFEAEELPWFEIFQRHRHQAEGASIMDSRLMSFSRLPFFQSFFRRVLGFFGQELDGVNPTGFKHFFDRKAA